MGGAPLLARLAPALLLGLAGLGAAPATAQQPPAPSQGLVERDGTIGSAPGGVVAPGPDDLGTADYLIRADLGEQRGRNLFHSFLRFSIARGERATFTDQGAPDPGAIENVISRVTGGELSQIDGMLHSTIPGADVWLLNPSGVVFGAGAELDVKGSFHAATADYLGFEGGLERFYAKDSLGPSVLATAPPATFGFLRKATVASVSLDGAKLSVPEGETLSLVGGDVVLDGATLEAENGRVNLAAVASAGEVVPAPADAREPLEMRGFGALGEVRLQARDGVGSRVDAGGASPGSVFIRSGRLFVQGGAVAGQARSLVLAQNSGTVRAESDGPGPGLISVQASESVLVDNGLLSVATSGAGDAGEIHVKSPSVSFRHGPGWRLRPTEVGAGAETTGTGDAGRIRIEAHDLTVTDGVAVSVPAIGSGSLADEARGDGGTIEIVAHSVELSNRSFIGAAAIGSSSNAGTITIDLGDDGSLQVGNAQDPPPGDYTWLVAGAFHVGLPGTTGPGSAGHIGVKTGSLVVEGVGLINVGTEGQAAGGTLAIEARSLELREGGSLISGTNGSGNAGSITIGAGSLAIDDGGRITAQTTGTGNAGSIDVTAGSVVIGSGGLINAETTGRGTSLEDKGGNAGDIHLVADSLEIQTGGAITTNSLFGGAFGGDAGDIDITANDWISLTNVGGDRFDLPGVLAGTTSLSGIFSATVGSGGAGGSIRLAAPEITVTEGAIASTATIGGGAGGTVELFADRIRIANGGFVDSTTAPLTLPVFAPGGPAGNVTLEAQQWIEVGGANEYGDPSLVASRSLGLGPGLGEAGDVTLRAPSLRLFDGGSVTTNADQANGGDITLHAQNLVHLDAGVITSSVNGESGGNITIDPVFVILENGSQILATATTGRGGRIQITTENFFAFPGSEVSAKSGNPELSGTVEIKSPDVNLAGTLAPLPSAFLDAASLMRERCAARRSGERSGSFAVRGPGGIPAEPDGWLRAPVLLEVPATPAAAAAGPPALLASLSGPLLAHGTCP